MSDAVAEKVINLVARTKRVPPEQVTPDKTFQELGMDSLDGLNLVFELEREFDISIPEDDARALRTVQQAIEGVHKLLAGGAATAASD